MKFWPLTLVLVVFISLVAILTYEAGSIYSYTDSVDGGSLPEVDVIVLLAGGRGRIAAGGDLWFRYHEREMLGDESIHTPVLYFSGVGEGIRWSDLQKTLRPGVLKALKPSDFVIEEDSQNTVQNAKFFLNNAQIRGWKSALLMTSSYHMRRAEFIFQKIISERGQAMKVDTLSILQEPFNSDEWNEDFHGLRVTWIEYVKWLYYTRLYFR